MSLIGSRLGHYLIEELRGKGGMGEVYRAQDARLGRHVALKVLPAELAGDTAYRARLEREAKTVSQLQHPHICALYDIGSEGGVDYLVLEYLEGETLEERLRRGPLAVDDVLRIGIEVAEALAAAHRRGVVHRDLKPGNLMLTEAGTKVLDFGLAREVLQPGASVDTQARTRTADAITRAGAMAGTLPYMAPEQLESRRADARSDIWALGCVLYEMATGQRPFAGESAASLITAIMSAEPDPPSRRQPLSPAQLDRVVARCLEKDPKRRWQSAGDVALELAANEPRAKRTSRPMRGVFRWLLAALVLGAAGVWWLADRGDETAPQTEPAPVHGPIASLAVLPFDNLTQEPVLEVYALGIPESILGRMAGVWPVVPSNTSFPHRGEKVCEAARAMEVGVVMEGSVQRAADRLHVNARLARCPAGTQFWADSFEAGLEDPVATQDDIARRIIAAYQQTYLQEMADVPGTPLWHFFQWTREDMATALEMFRQAEELDPQDAEWPLWTAYALVLTLWHGWAEPPFEPMVAEIEEAVERCLTINPRYFACHHASGLRYMLTGETDAMVAAMRHAHSIAGWSVGFAEVGNALLLAGRPDEAISSIRQAISLSPEDPAMPQWRNFMAAAHFGAGRYEEAADWARQSIELNDRHYLAHGYLYLAASLVQLGRLDEAHAAVDEALARRPGLSLEVFRLFRSTSPPELRERWLDSLRAAGLPEE